MSSNKSSNKSSFGFIIDPFAGLNPKKDSSLAMMRAVLDMGGQVFVAQMHDLSIDGDVSGRFQPVGKDMTAGAAEVIKLADLDGVFMRKDPPIDDAYYACTQILSVAQAQGAKIYNDPQVLRDESEKLFALHFPELIPETIVSAQHNILRDFVDQHGTAIFKPLNVMGGAGIFLIEKADMNFDVIWETLTHYGKQPIMAQRFLPAINEGDKRVIIFNGAVVDHVLVRTPKAGAVRGNMAAGGTTHIAKINDHDRKVAEVVAKAMVEKGVSFAGIDIIGDKLIEVNHTCPTGIVQISDYLGRNIAEDYIKGL